MIRGQQAQLQTKQFSGTLDLTVPTSGLQQLCVAGQSLPKVQLLGVCLVNSSGDISEIHDHYSRNDSLIVRYGDSQQDRQQVQFQWHCINPQAGHVTAGLELIVSFEAPILTQLPAWTTTSQVSLQHTYCSGKDAQQPWKPLAEISTATNQDPSSTKNCSRMFLCRFPEQNLSYVEMIHPQESSLTILPDQKNSPIGTARWGVRMPGDYLEKGVILRKRVRGIFLPLERDEILAWETYQQFLALAPPLN